MNEALAQPAGAPRRPRASMQGALSPFLCPRCGGEIAVREGARIGRCSYCGTSLLARARDGLLRYALLPSVDGHAAGGAVRALFRDPEAPADLARRAVLQSQELLFVPYWRFQATVVGRLTGTRTVRRQAFLWSEDGEAPAAAFRPGREVTRTEAVDKPIRKIWTATLSACPADDVGIPSLSPLRQRAAGMLVTRPLDGLDGLRFFDRSLFDRGTVLDVMTPQDRARRDAEGLFQRFIQSRGFGVRDKQIRWLKLQERCYLLYYPVYVLRFRYRRRIYTAAVDGHHGRVIHAHLPVEPRHQVGALLGATLGAALLTTAPFRAVLFPPEGLTELGGLGASPRLWVLAGVVAAGLVAAGRFALAQTRFPLERIVHGE